MKKAVVVGGSGFIGSHVADQLSDAGHKVRIFDCVESPWLRPNQEMIVGDLLGESSTLMDALEGHTVVYNFAGVSDLDDALDKPFETTKVNVLGNVILLEACRKAKVQRYIPGTGPRTGPTRLLPNRGKTSA